MREHGLIMPNRTKSWLAKYNDALRPKNPTGKYSSAGRFVAFMQINNAITFDRIVEGLQYEHDLRKFLLKLVFSINFNKIIALKTIYSLSHVDYMNYVQMAFCHTKVVEFFKSFELNVQLKYVRKPHSIGNGSI